MSGVSAEISWVFVEMLCVGGNLTYVGRNNVTKYAHPTTLMIIPQTHTRI